MAPQPIDIAYEALRRQQEENDRALGKVYARLCVEMLRMHNAGHTYTRIANHLNTSTYSRRDVSDMCTLARLMIRAGRWTYKGNDVKCF